MLTYECWQAQTFPYFIFHWDVVTCHTAAIIWLMTIIHMILLIKVYDYVFCMHQWVHF